MPLCTWAVPLELALNQQDSALGRPNTFGTLLRQVNEGQEPFTNLLAPEEDAATVILSPTGIGEKYELVEFKVGDRFRICYTDTENGVWEWEKTNDESMAVIALGLQTLTELPETISYCQLFEVDHAPEAEPESSEVFSSILPTSRVTITYSNLYPLGDADTEPQLTYSYLIKID